MRNHKSELPPVTELTAVREWRSGLAATIGAFLLFETVTGVAIYVAGFSRVIQFSVVLHTLAGLGLLVPLIWYVIRHWWVRRKGNLSHFQLLGYIALVLLVLCLISGIVVTWQGLVGPRMDYVWDVVHLITGIGLALFVIAHLATVVVKKVNNPESLRRLRHARRVFYVRTMVGCGVLVAVCVAWAGLYREPLAERAFSPDYNWRFGEDRPFAPSLARLDQSAWHKELQQRVYEAVGPEYRSAFAAAFQQKSARPVGMFDRIEKCAAGLDLDERCRQQLRQVTAEAADAIKARGAVDAAALAGSAGCGTGGCHEQIYEEWLPSAHRFSSLDDMFQRVQKLMSKETSPEHTRYCAGCHDPISLFSGAKNAGNVTLSAVGADEGISCLVCHSIVQTDVQGNGDYTIRAPHRYVYEQHRGRWAKLLSDFLIRTYPDQHVSSYSRSLYKTPEFCGACHKQYLDKEVNTDIGKVQGQNQYDSWKNSRWYMEEDPKRTITCRECHMPLNDSHDPARGDETDYNRTANDGKHRSHRTLAANQYIPRVHKLKGWKNHVELTARWLQGKIAIPEIADKWMSGPVVKMDIVAPEEVQTGNRLSVQVILTNNKAGHDFPTGPLDMLESWIELKVADANGKLIFHSGAVGEDGRIQDAKIWYKADGFDRQGQLIDRHNLWDLVGAKYKRTLYPGVTDSMDVQFQCPSMARGRVSLAEGAGGGQRREGYAIPTPPHAESGELTVSAVLWYRKANPEFLDRVYGPGAGLRSPITELTRQSCTIRVVPDSVGQASNP